MLDALPRPVVAWARRLAARRSLILLYHGVGPTSLRIDPGFLRVTPDAFRTQLDILCDAGFEFVTVGEFAERAAGGEPPPGLVALSFDDGMDDNHALVLPILRARRLRATVYVATGLMGKPNPWLSSDSGGRMMTADELRDLVSAGFEIGAHTVSHADLSKLDFARCLGEMQESRETLEQLLGVEVRTFAYPFCRFGPAAVAAARAAGFTAAVTCNGLGSWDPFELRRTLVTGKDRLPIFLLKLADLYEPLHGSAPSRLIRASTRGLRTYLRRRRERYTPMNVLDAARAPASDETDR